MRCIGAVADHLQAEIGFDRRADVESPAVEQWPAAVLALDAAQIGADLAFQHRIVRFAQILAQQDVLRRNRRIGLELEHPMPVGALLLDQRLYRTAYAGLEIVWRNVHCLVVMRALSAAARSPERNAPSMVAGSPVSVQSPASKRLAHRVEGEGRRAFCAGVAAKVARFSLTIRQGGGTSGRDAATHRPWRLSS